GAAAVAATSVPLLRHPTPPPPPSPPPALEQPTTKQGMPTVNEVKLEPPKASVAPVASTPATAPRRSAPAWTCAKALAAAGLVTACQGHIKTGTRTGDCSRSSVRPEELGADRIPGEHYLEASPAELAEMSACRGWVSDAVAPPCYVKEGPIS